jgi:hypothetical protein
MATSYKVLGQQDLTSSTLTDALHLPGIDETVISTIIIANRASER